MSSDRKPRSSSKTASREAASRKAKPTSGSGSKSEATSSGRSAGKGGSQAKLRSGGRAKAKGEAQATREEGSEAKPASRSRGKPRSRVEEKPGSRAEGQARPRTEAKAKGGSEAKPRSRSKPKQQAGRKREPGEKAGRRRRAPAREISAGGVVVRGDQVVVIVPTRRASDGSRVLGLPKGHVDPGETPIQAAEREVREETGIVAEAVRELGEARYWYRRNGRTIGKSVSFYLFSHLGGDTADHDDEVEEVRWIGLKEAHTALTHEAEREMVGLALASLEEGAPKDR